jgi:signal transduction histidine kinase
MRLSVDGPNDELRTLASAFNGMLDRLEQAFTQQSQFVADAAHELRTPLATLRTTLDVYGAQENIPPEDYEAYIKTSRRQLARLERLAADLLFLAQGGQEQTCEEIVLGPLLDELVDQFQELAKQQRVHLLPAMGETGAVVVADSQHLTRVFNNLIENGLLYNRSGGLLEINIVVREAWAVTTITDTGIGIAEADLPHIFDRFYRAERSRSRHQGGAGLGLALVADLLHRNGGRIEVTSRPGIGSAFIVYLPCLATQDPNTEAQ